MRRFLCILTGSLLAIAAWAHKSRLTETEIVVLPTELRLQITHALHLDDAMPLLASLGDPRGQLNLETRARLLLYVGERFALSAGETPIELEPVGAELDGDTLWIYQEASLSTEALAALGQRAGVWNRLMHDRDRETQNLVNLRLDRVVRSATLTPEAPTRAF